MKRLIILLSVFLVAIIGCSHTTRNSPMLKDQAELIRSNWENLKMGMGIEEVTNLFGSPTVQRTQQCYCNECASLGAVNQKIEKLWYVYQPSAKGLDALPKEHTNIYIYLAFRHGRLFDGRAKTMSGVILLK